MKLALVLAMVLSLTCAQLQEYTIFSYIRKAMFWSNKKTFHGICAAYNGRDYIVSDECMNEQFQEHYLDSNKRIFDDILSFEILNNATDFNRNILGLVQTVKGELTTCGCAQLVIDMEEWYDWNVGDAKVWVGVEEVFWAVIMGYLRNPGEMVLFTIGQVFMTMTFNFYYLGWMIGKMASFVFKPY